MMRNALLFSFVAALAVSGLGCAATTDAEEEDLATAEGARSDKSPSDDAEKLYFVSCYAECINWKLERLNAPGAAAIDVPAPAHPYFPLVGQTAEEGSRITQAIRRGGAVVSGTVETKPRRAFKPSAFFLSAEGSAVTDRSGATGAFYEVKCGEYECINWALERANARQGEAAIEVPTPAAPDFPLVGQTTEAASAISKAVRRNGAVIAFGTVAKKPRLAFKPTAFFVK